MALAIEAHTINPPIKIPAASLNGRRKGVGIDLIGCGFCRWSLRGCRRELAICPYRAIGKELLFPDRNGLLQSVDGVAAGIEGSRAMGGANGNEHTGLADFQLAEPVHNGYAVNRIHGVEMRGDLLHL